MLTTTARATLRNLATTAGETLCHNRLVILAELVLVALVRFGVLLPFSPATIPLLLLGTLSLWLRQSGWDATGWAGRSAWPSWPCSSAGGTTPREAPAWC